MMDTDYLIQASDFRRNATFWLAIVALVLLTPFAINNFIHDRFWLGVGSLAIVVSLGFNGWRIRRAYYSLWPTQLALVPAILFFLTLSILKQRIFGVLWCYPAILSFYIILPERRALVANGLLLAVAIPASLVTFEPTFVIRIGATLVAVSTFSAIFIHAITVQQQTLQTIAATDTLTGLYNRAVLDNALEQALLQADRSAAPMALLAIDIDHFKSVNDSYGHLEGDEVLRQVGELLRQRLRGSDTVFRLGGEEFLALLFNTDIASAKRVAEDLRQTFESFSFIKDRTITVSIGVASLIRGESADEWMQRADNNLYCAKDAGRNCVIA